MIAHAKSLMKRLAKDPADAISCVLCGEPLYASERSLQVQCKFCRNYLHVRDLHLTTSHSQSRTITCTHLLVDTRARITGDLIARSIEIRGTVAGNIFATTDVRLTPTARVVGHILCSRLHISPGALIDGTIERIVP